MELKTVHTCCKDCIFASYEGNTQTGCNFYSRLARYEEQDPECVVEAQDGEKEFFLVNGRRCTAYRQKDWGERYKPGEWQQKVRQEITTKVDFLIYVDGDSVEEDNLKLTLDSIKNQTRNANGVLVVNNSTIHPGKLQVMLRKLGEGLTWSQTHIHERVSDGGHINRERAVDLAEGKLKGHYYSLLIPGAAVPTNWCKVIDVAVSERLARFSVIRPSRHGQLLTVATGFHRAALIGGNKPVAASDFHEENAPLTSATVTLNNVLEKAEYISKIHDMPYLVIDYDELWKF